MAKLKLLSTIFSKLGSLTKNNGQIIVSRDSKSLYVDLDDERIEITDWIDINTEENLLAILTPLTNKYYYTKDNNKIWRYINNDWECLNTSVNDLTPTYTESSNLVKLSSGEKLSVAFGKISKAITDLISHISDSVKHITSAERSNWNAAKTHADSTHAPADAQKNVQSDWSATSGDAYIKNKPTEFPPSIHTHTKSEISDFPSSLPASGGNADTVNNHTVKSNVPTDAVFTDTIYDDTEVKKSIEELSSKLVFDLFGEKLFQYDDNNSISISILPRKNVPIKDAVSNLDRNLDEIAEATNSISENLNSKTNELNSNLSQLSYSDVAGGKNKVFGVSYGYINSSGYYFTDNDSTSVICYLENGKTYKISCNIKPFADNIRIGKIYSKTPENGTVDNMQQLGKGIDTFTSNFTGYAIVYTHPSKNENVINSIQIEEGTQATDYKPYIPSVKMLAEEVNQQKNDLSVIGKCKNLLNPKFKTITRNGVTCTANGDGTYTLNGTASNDTGFNVCVINDIDTLSKLICKDSQSKNFNVFCEVYNDGEFIENKYDYGDGIEIQPSSYDYKLWVKVYAGKTVTNETIKPMLTTDLNATYDDFVPYTGDGETLTHDVAELKNDLTPILIQKQISESDWSADGNVYITYVTLTDDIPSNKKVLSLYQERMYKGDEQSWLGGIIVNNNDVGTKLVVFSTTKINCTLGLQVVLI